MSALPLLVSNAAKESVVRAMSSELGLPSDEADRALEFFHLGLPPLTRRAWLPFLFGISTKLIGAMEARSERYYRRFRLNKRAGGFRDVATPRRYLKTIQRWMLHRVFSHLPVSEAAHGFVVGRSIFTNSAMHLEGANVLATDLRDFFPTVTHARVLELLSAKLPFPDDVVAQLTGLCTLDGALPQGAPTSPCLANAVFELADSELAELANAWGVRYSRYADDMAFSGERKFSSADVAAVKDVVERAGFVLHPNKTRIMGRGVRQVVAGLVVNAVGLPPRLVRRRWRAMFHRASKHPHEFIDRTDQLSGVASFIKQYDTALATQYRAVVDHVRAAGGEDAS